ncbi:sushi, von Willebrand factor type A, EGF and pentraxin domain-containing protein 1 isoform X1 [Oryzias latipes]|uniref:sushi, von Willebrand factor type A, EGF and pentraxin domain-containing protein 1 isoform X1 n=1 Tax=Oryzias latipes TaxID=8090 RepID=UPI0002A48E53|nr:sushi, von Willebrand factor type A, EGF and pentraxin domain-containing protein 1 isoform X1 [Oryzias latipes]
MRSAAGILLLLSFALLSSAQVAQECSIPREFQGARLVRDYPSTVKFNSGDRVYYGCRDGFTPMDGKPFVECRNGAWSKLTLQCEQKSCSYVGDLHNGEFIYEGNSYLGEKAHAKCNKGYTLRGSNFMLCTESGWVGKFPSCEEGEPTCLAPVVANSAQRAGTVYQVGDRINLSCKIGFQLEGPNEITCAPNGQWQPKPPQCVPTLERTQPRTEQTNEKGDCEAPPPVIGSNAYLVDKYAMMTSFSSGDKVYYSCNVGYTARAGSRSRRCKNGKWTQLKLKCERKLCGHAGEIENGHFVYTGVKFGDVATAKCNEGYILVGRATRNCRSQGWDGRIPVCEVAICDKPKKTNAISKGPEEPPYRYRSVIRYQCQVGMLDGPREIYCTSNGTWNASPPQCKEFTCPPPNVPHAYWMGAHREKFNAMDVISIDCDRGYSIQGPTSITCSRDGRWIPSLPSCQPAHRPQY